MLAHLDTWAGGEGEASPVAAIVAPPGLGKTCLLRVFQARLDERAATGSGFRDSGREGGRVPKARTLYLPYASLSIVELCAWIYGLLGRDAEPMPAIEDPVAAFAALVALGKGAGGPFHLLIDDADSLPIETARIFAEGLPSRASPLRLVMAMNDDARASRLLAVFEPQRPLHLSLRMRLTQSETAAYVRARMRWAGCSESELSSIDEAGVRRIHVLSAGVPREIHRHAAAFLEPGLAGASAVFKAKRKRELWMGRPIEDED